MNARSVLSEVSIGENGILNFLGKFHVRQVPPCYVRAWWEILYTSHVPCKHSNGERANFKICYFAILILLERAKLKFA